VPESVDGSVPAFVIEEVTGEQRVVRLTSRALPYRPFTLKGMQSHDKTKYPASPIQSLQVLGPDEGSTTIKGQWKDRFIMQAGYNVAAPGLDTSFAPSIAGVPATVDNTPVANVLALVSLVDDMRRKGQLVKVTWMEISRFGLIASFSQSWNTVNDVEWEIEFEWVSQAEDPLAARVALPSADATALPGDAQHSFVQTVAAVAKSIVSIAQDAADAIETVEDTVQRTITQIQSTVQNGVDGLLAPVDAARNLAAMTQTLVSSYSETMDYVVSRTQEELSFGEFLSQSARALASRRTCRAARDQAANAQRAMLVQIDPDLIGIVRARANDDLRRVAEAFYGDANAWRMLLTYNHLESSRLAAGDIVLIPKRPQ
jgi:hypothetical protein